MRIEIRGRNVAVGDELRERAERRFAKVARQVSPLARLELELGEERNPAIANSQVAEATLYLKGVTLRARDASGSMPHAINLVADELARQVKRHREKRRGRRDAPRRPLASPDGPAPLGATEEGLATEAGLPTEPGLAAAAGEPADLEPGPDTGPGAAYPL